MGRTLLVPLVCALACASPPRPVVADRPNANEPTIPPPHANEPTIPPSHASLGPLSCRVQAVDESWFDDLEAARRAGPFDWAEDVAWASLALRPSGAGLDIEVDWTNRARRGRAHGQMSMTGRPEDEVFDEPRGVIVGAAGELALLRICSTEDCGLFVARETGSVTRLEARIDPHRTLGFAMPNGGMAVLGRVSVALDAAGQVVSTATPLGPCTDLGALYPDGLATVGIPLDGPACESPPLVLEHLRDAAMHDRALQLAATMPNGEVRTISFSLPRALHRGCTIDSVRARIVDVVLPGVAPRISEDSLHNDPNGGARSVIRVLSDDSACFVRYEHAGNWEVRGQLLPEYLVARDDGSIRGIVGGHDGALYVDCRGAP